LKSSRIVVSLLAMLLAPAACAQGDSSPTASDEVYEFPAELIAAGESAAMATTTTVPSLSEPEEAEPVEPPPPRAVVEALNAPDPLPLPSSDLLPEVARLEPFVVTDNGDRRLLREIGVEVSHSTDEGLVVEPAGWWVVNYPLERIVGFEGRTVDEIARLLTGRDSDDVTNYYFYTAPEPGEKVQELPVAIGPDSIEVTRGPDLVVNNQDPDASDDNNGSHTHPLLTISEAVSRAAPGTVIHVYPGTYRESVVVTADGTVEEPISIEGIRGASGAMPVITGNDPFPIGAWAEVDALSGVYAATAFTDLAGSMTIDGESLISRSAPWDIGEGEYIVTNGGDAYVEPRFDGNMRVREGGIEGFGSSQYIWELKETDGGGFVDLGSEFGEDFEGGVFWGSTWVYIERPDGASDYEWYNSFDFDLQTSGPFRSKGISGTALSGQPFDYRVWLDGELLESSVHATSDNGEILEAHPEIGAGVYGETWHGVWMEEGWHHLVFQWDTTTASGNADAIPSFRFGVPEIVGDAVTVAERPSASSRAPQGDAHNYLSEYLVLGPVPSPYEPTVYVRLPDGADPNQADLDLAARSGPVVSILGDFVELHGFDVYGGAQAEGESMISVGRRGDETAGDVHVHGVVVDGNHVSGSQYGGIGVVVSGDMAVEPIEITNNWVVDSGAIGISVRGVSDRLTPDTVNDWAPGRTRVTVQFNTVLDTGWAGYDWTTDVSGILFERMTGSTIAYNTVDGGGPGITLRGENYGIRVDGNTVTNPYAWGIGVEANPGPNLIANNLITGLNIGPDWYKGHLLTWDSDQTWIINNTVDGEWNIDTGWYAEVGTWGAGGPENFERIDYASWVLDDFRRTYVNNLLLGNYLGGIEDYSGNWGEVDSFSANYREVPSPTDPFDYLADGAERADVRYDFIDRADGDYRLKDSSELNAQGMSNLTSQMAALDLLGLPRYLGDTTSVGAYRASFSAEPGTSVIEVLFADGTITRIGG